MQTLILKNEKQMPVNINKFKMVMLAFILLASFSTAWAQTFYSNFATPAGNFSIITPSGSSCVVPTLTDGQNVADADLTNYAQISGLVSLPIGCENQNYSIRARLNTGGSSAPIGHQAGFRIATSQLIGLNVLGDSFSIQTYEGGVLRQTAPGSSLIGLSLLTTPNVPVDVYFTASQPFDEVEIVFNPSLINLGVGVDYRIYYAVAAPTGTLPVAFEGLSAKIQGGNLIVDWNTVSEKDNDKFVVQGSSDGKTWMDLGTVATKAPGGNSSVKIAYSFSRQWGDTILAGFGLLGLLLLPAVRNRLMRVGMLIVVVSMVVACAKDNDGFQGLEDGSRAGKATYIRVAQVDKDGAITHTQPVVAKR
ncbi:MAG: hypothetical protein REI64_05335 [Pedobacter sp.]|uniref:hypothetical protein n=1 Tax=Pedobacter sp. TaxID=1411316 RepID=UPI0028068F5B|nr:hypothetical protein [Pedobacter sp.]MDQ8004202.1 hypothetical protein [Pedobacter sp.]